MDIRYIFLFFIIIAFAACKKFDNISTAEWQPEVAFTLFNSTVNTSDLFENYVSSGELLIDDQQQLTLVYSGGGYAIESRDVLNLIPDVSFPMIDTFMKLPYPLPAEVEIDFIRAKSGLIQITTGNTYMEPLELTFTIPEATLDGVPFSRTTTIGAASALIPLTPSIQAYELADYVLTPESDSMIFHYSARLVNSDSLVILQAVVVDFQDPVYSYAQGFLGTGTFYVPLDSIALDFYQYFNNGEVFFEEPQMTITARNSFGFPMRTSFNVLNAITVDGETIPFGNQALADGIDFNYPTIDQIGETKETVVVIGRDNSNIENIIGQPVIYFEYDAEVSSNPDNDLSITSFVTDSSNFYLDAEVELPLYGRVNGFTISDTFDFVEISEDFDNVNSVEFKLVTVNEFPADVELQVLFADENYNIIEKLLDPAEMVFESSTVNDLGEITELARKETFIPLSKERFNTITQDAKYMLVQIRIWSFENGETSVRIYEDTEVTIKLGVIGEVTL